MTYGLTVEPVELVELVESVEPVEPVVLALKDDFGVAFPAVPSVASAPAMRRFSSAVGTELVAGLVFGVGTVVAAFADELSSAAATAAATPAAATGRASRIRRL
ncbi:hypothetical protein [Streptomyces sp. NPDC050534]|uniref:hypothetical protein n=1 Tax=Streptomyces sp. NPDC050534 TaxID=3365625 RepID=UPI00379434D6